MILQVNHHQFELAEKVHAQQAVYLLPKAVRELTHVHGHDLVISPCDMTKLQSDSCERSCADQARTLTCGDQIIQRTRSHVSEFRTYNRAIRRGINDQNG